MIQKGTVLDGRFKIRGEIGRGGMNIVYLAEETATGKPYAVKAVRPDRAADFSMARQSLWREIRLLKALSHPCLPKIYDVIDSGEGLLIVMEYIEGTSLAQILQQEGPQPAGTVIRWAEQLCGILQLLHAQDPPFIYRDMKPSNIIQKPDGNLVLIDFGTVRERKAAETPEDTVCLGTRRYAAPEQFGGMGQSDERSDIYSLGAALYHLLTGQPPAVSFYGLKKIGEVRPALAGSVLEEILEKCTRREPEERYQTCEALLAALSKCKGKNGSIRKKRNRKRGIRSGILLVLAGCIFLTAGFRTDPQEEEGPAEGSGYFLELASAQETMQAAKPFFLEALKSRPGDPEVYGAMLQKAETDILAAQGVLTGETAAALNECLMSTASGRQSNLSVLKEEAPQTYAKVLYEVGLWYFFLKNGTDAARRTASENYFLKIREEPYIGYLSEEQQELTKLLYELGKSSVYLDGGLVKYGSEEMQGSARLLFDRLQKMVQGDLKEKVGKEGYCIRIYQQAAFWLNADLCRFEEDGITPTRMLALLKTIEEGMDRLQIEPDSIYYPDWKEAKETIDNTRRLLQTSEAAFRKEGEKECREKNTGSLQPQ